MALDESDKAVVRHFLATNAAKRWLENGRRSCPKMDPAKVPIDNYHASLTVKEGWIALADFLENSVKEDLITEYGVPPIDTVSD